MLTTDFLDYLLLECGFAHHTIKCYANDLDQFKQFEEGRTGHEIDLLRISKADVQNYLRFLGGRKLQKSTVARKMATLRSFYKFCLKKGHPQNNPMLGIKLPRQEKRKPRCLEKEQIERLLKTPDVEKFLGLRDRAVLETIYSTGIRVSELSGLNLQDVDFAGAKILVRGIKNRERFVPIPSVALVWIRRYLDLRLAHPRCPQWNKEALFLNQHGRRLGARNIRRNLEQYALKSGIKSANPTMMRHSFGTHMLNQGLALGEVQAWMGHRSPTTTQLYIQKVGA